MNQRMCHAPRTQHGFTLLELLVVLVFLGTERYPAADNLMAYVQRHGGQVNARTSERHTDFFFELPIAAFEGGLARLCDMLAQPRMNQAEQLREREVLHAEFIAWAREPSAQRQFGVRQSVGEIDVYAGQPLRLCVTGQTGE